MLNQCIIDNINKSTLCKTNKTVLSNKAFPFNLYKEDMDVYLFNKSQKIPKG